MWYARLVLVVSVFLFFLPTNAISHPGGLNADGCHVKKKTGKKHCHDKKDGVKKKAAKKKAAKKMKKSKKAKVSEKATTKK
ncbi:MAG: YHYH domain-containing protein, partial [Nitrospirales bacterium]